MLVFVAPGMAGRLCGPSAHWDRRWRSRARVDHALAVRHGDIWRRNRSPMRAAAERHEPPSWPARHDRPARPVQTSTGSNRCFPGSTGGAAPHCHRQRYIMGCHMKAYPRLATGQGSCRGIALLRRPQHRPVRSHHGGDRRPAVPVRRRTIGRVNPLARSATTVSLSGAVALIDGDFGLEPFDNER